MRAGDGVRGDWPRFSLSPAVERRRDEGERRVVGEAMSATEGDTGDLAEGEGAALGVR